VDAPRPRFAFILYIFLGFPLGYIQALKKSESLIFLFIPVVIRFLKPVLWIRIPHWFQSVSGFGSSFYLKTDPDPDPRSQTNADPYESVFRSNFKVTKS
jgi:hypothetical protein